MAQRCTAEQACKAVLNDDDLGEIESADSLDESFSNTSSSSSCSEIDSDPENDYCGRVINVVTLPERGRPRTRTLNAQRIRGGVCVRGGRSRGIRTRGGNNNMPPSKRLAPDITDDDLSSGDRSSDLEENVVDHDNWKNNPPTIQDFPFNEKPGLKIDILDNAGPMFFFGLILTDKFVESLVSKTNEHPNRVINANRPLRHRTTWNSWTDVNVLDMKKFIGLIFCMGLISLPSYKRYWSKDLLYKNKHFPSVFSRERFESILRFFNFGEKPMFENDRLSKLRTIMDHLNKVMLEVVAPEKNLSIDESMMLWRGRLVSRQYVKNKRHKYGIKFYKFCTYDRLVLTVEAYGGQGFNDEHNLVRQQQSC